VCVWGVRRLGAAKGTQKRPGGSRGTPSLFRGIRPFESIES